MEPGLVALGRCVCSIRLAERGEIDLIEDFASAIPVEVIGNLLDVPHDERAPLRDWSLAILGALEPALTPEQLEARQRAVTDFIDYLETLVARRRAQSRRPAARRADAADPRRSRRRAPGEAELLHNCIFISTPATRRPPI